jgi:uncharacterized repeat protein (TIGR01451 family)
MGVTLVLLVLGGVFVDPALLSLSLIPLLLVAYGALSKVQSTTLVVERTIDPSHPQPGGTATVTLSISNQGEQPASDLRIVDGVPEALPVTRGEPRSGVALRAGETTSLSYDVRARRGVHTFADPTIVASNLAGDAFVEADRHVDGDRTLVPSVPVGTNSLGERRHAVRGSTAIDSGGNGVEFYVTREYRPGDPMNRIDWRRYAKTGALSTIEYREEGGTPVLLLVDARDVTATTVTSESPTGRNLSLYLAGRLVDTVSNRGDQVGVAAIGPDGQVRWVAPETSSETRATGLIQAVATDTLDRWDGPALDLPTDDAEAIVDWLAERVDSTTTILLLSAVTDDLPIGLADRLRAHGRSPTVLSPFDTSADTVGARIGTAQRAARLDRLRTVGTVIDWQPGNPLPADLTREEVIEA